MKTITIKEKHLKKGEPRQVAFCPVALAIQEANPQWCGAVRVCGDYCTIEGEVCKFPENVVDFIECVDAEDVTGARSYLPLTFQLVEE